MRNATRQQYNALGQQIARVHEVDDVRQQFSIAPSVEQRWQDKIVEQSTFLPQINVITVDDMEGQNILGFAAGPVSGRTDVSVDGNERTPRNVLGMAQYGYKLAQTDSDVYLPYSTLDAWARFKDFAQRYTRYVQDRIANDRELVGWYGEQVADTTDLATYPMLQDVNKGWLQYMREKCPGNVLQEGATAGELRIGEGGDYINLDVAVNDLLQGIPLYLRKDLQVLVGDELIAQERAALFAAVGGKPTEKNAMNTALAVLGGLPWQTPSNFPGRGLVITSTKNLSIYTQGSSWRRNLKDKPEKNRTEDYNSRNEGYVVENPKAMVAWDFKNVMVKSADGSWS
ncbi:phage major capsid protein, P2 family [Desulfobaculum senezii]